jgi:hypothetical protein
MKQVSLRRGGRWVVDLLADARSRAWRIMYPLPKTSGKTRRSFEGSTDITATAPSVRSSSGRILEIIDRPVEDE